MNLQTKKWLTSTVAAAAMALAAGSASALEVTGGLTLVPGSSSGLDTFAFSLSGDTDLTISVSGTSLVQGALYDGGTLIDPDDFLKLKKQVIYTFEGLTAGIYSFDLFGAAGGSYKLSIISDYGVTVSPVPEPESLALALGGLGVLGLLGRRRLAGASA